MDKAQMLSDNFSLASMLRSNTATAQGISNLPNEKELANLKLLATKILEPLREELDLPIHVNSGFRSEKLNKAVKGVSTSAHRLGYTADIICPAYKGGNVREFCLYVETFLKRKNIKFDQLIYEFVGGSKWVHIGIKNEAGLQRGEVLTIHNRKTSPGIKNV